MRWVWWINLFIYLAYGLTHATLIKFIIFIREVNELETLRINASQTCIYIQKKNLCKSNLAIHCRFEGAVEKKNFSASLNCPQFTLLYYVIDCLIYSTTVITSIGPFFPFVGIIGAHIMPCTNLIKILSSLMVVQGHWD